ncbi:hypothetical protein D3C86_1317370 [compost metagenome]
MAVGQVEGRDRRILDEVGHAVVHVGLDPVEAVDHLGVAHHEAAAPAGHVVGLAHGVELEGAVLLGAGDLEQAGRLEAVEGQIRVSQVMHQHDLVALGELQGVLVERAGRDRRGRVAGEVEDEQLGGVRVLGAHGVPLGQEARVRQAGNLDDLATREDGAAGVDRVGGLGHDGLVAGVDEGQGQLGEAFLGADEGQHLGLGVEFDPVAALVPGGDRLAEGLLAAEGRVAVVRGILDGGDGRVDDRLRGGQVGRADPQIDDRHPLLLRGGAQHFELGGRVGGNLLETVGFLEHRLVGRGDHRHLLIEAWDA